MNPWTEILTPEEIDAYHRMTATLDPAFAAQERAWYLARTADELRTLTAQSWNSNDSSSYRLSRSYAAMQGA